MLVYKTKEAAAFSIIPLTLNSAAPFWYVLLSKWINQIKIYKKILRVLLATVPTVRQLLPEIDLGRDIVSWVL